MLRRLVLSAWFTALFAAVAGPAAAQSDIVIRASQVTSVHGNWVLKSDPSAAGGQLLSSTDYSWSSTSTPQASPTDYFDVSFSATANTPYHVWFRLRAGADNKYNDSVWVQYSDATDSSGARVYPIGSTSGLDVNLERCSGCGESGWGWQDGAYWLSQTTTVRFPTTGSHTLRVQTREDGVQIDQIVISPATYISTAPGSATNDTTIVSTSSGAASTAPGPYSGTAVSLPGRVEGENFDNGGEGVAYHDTTAGNAGNVYRQADVDVQGCASGGYNVGWTQPGEWLNYTVNVTAAGSYTVGLRVASVGGGSLHVGFNTASNVWKTVTIPDTGGWQNWTTVTVPVTVGAGKQQITILFDTGNVNLDYIDVTAGSGSSTPPPSTGTTLNVAEWNIQVNDGGSGHAQGAVDYMMALSPRPQVLVFAEAHASQYNTYLAELQAKTGQTWYGVFAPHCALGALSGTSCSSLQDEGVAVFSALPITSSSTGFLPYADAYHSARGFARAAMAVGGLTVQVFGVHLQPDNATARYNSMAYLKAYAGNYSAPMLAAGDFNAGPDQIDTSSGMLPLFVDTWKLVGSGSGNNAFTPNPSMKIDYWFSDASGRAKPTSTSVVTSTGTFSDHMPVRTTFSIQ